MKKFLVLLVAFLPLLAVAKDNKDAYNPKYLAGAVTMEDGKVVFSKNIDVPSMTKPQLYKTMLNWANEQFKPEDVFNSRVVYTSPEDGEIAVSAEEYIVFSSRALSLDRTRIIYQVFIKVEDYKCELSMSRIRYWYEENRDGGEKYKAEEWITDDMALNKKKTKLAPICGKFRKGTIDLKDDLFASAMNAIGGNAVSTPSSQNVIAATPVEPVTPATKSNGVLKVTTIDQLPQNINEIIRNGRLCIKVNEEQIDIKSESWGGFGKMFNKDVTYTIIEQSRMMANMMLQNCQSFSIVIYEKGKSSESVVIECKRPMQQEMNAEDLKSLNSNISGDKKYNMFIGEVSKVMCRQ